MNRRQAIFALLQRIATKLEAKQPLDDFDAKEIADLRIGSLDLKAGKLTLDQSKLPPLPLSDELISRAAKFWETFHLKVTNGFPMTQDDADEMAVLGMGEIDVVKQAFKLDEHFRKGWIAVCKDAEQKEWLENLDEAFLKMRH